MGRTTISPTSTLAGCSIANAIARAIASGGSASFSVIATAVGGREAESENNVTAIEPTFG